MTLDTLMHLADNFASLHRHSTDDESGKARAALYTALQSVSSKYQQGYAMALSDAEEAIDEECRQHSMDVSTCIAVIRNLKEAK